MEHEGGLSGNLHAKMFPIVSSVKYMTPETAAPTAVGGLAF